MEYTYEGKNLRFCIGIPGALPGTAERRLGIVISGMNNVPDAWRSREVPSHGDMLLV